jgi:hypothetical protein
MLECRMVCAAATLSLMHAVVHPTIPTPTGRQGIREILVGQPLSHHAAIVVACFEPINASWTNAETLFFRVFRCLPDGAGLDLKCSIMPAANIIQLRQLLAEKFPGLRTRADELSARTRDFWPTGLPQIDVPLHGGLPRSALTEIVAEKRGSGGALLLNALLRRALHEKQFVALIDGEDSLDVTQLGEDLSRLLWVRCHSSIEAMKAADLLLRDGNLPVVLLDLALNPPAQLRKIPATTWYRFQRITELSSAVCIVFTPRPMISPAHARITLQSRFTLRAQECEQEQLLRELQVDVVGQASRLPKSRQPSRLPKQTRHRETPATGTVAGTIAGGTPAPLSG